MAAAHGGAVVAGLQVADRVAHHWEVEGSREALRATLSAAAAVARAQRPDGTQSKELGL